MAPSFVPILKHEEKLLRTQGYFRPSTKVGLTLLTLSTILDFTMDGMAETHGEHDSEVIGRRSARLSLIAPVILRGIDAEGKPFKENTWTISVNKHGARLSTFYRLKVGDGVTVENPIYGRTAKGRVVRASEKHYPEDPYEISVELTEPANVWGVKFPPEDWQKDGWPALGRKSAGRVQTSATPPSEGRDGVLSAASTSGFSLPSPRRFPDPPQFSPPEASRQDAYSPAIARRLSASATENSQTQKRGLDTEPVAADNAIMLSAVQETTRQLEEKKEEFQSLARELAALAERLDSSRSELRALIKTAETKQDRLLIPMAGSSLEPAEGLKEKIQKEAETISSRFLAEAEARLQEKMQGTLEALTNATADRFASLQDEQAKRFGELLETSRSKAIEEARQELAQAASETQMSLAASRAAVDSFVQEARKVTDDFRGEVDKARQDYRETIQRELGTLAQEAVDEQREVLQEHVQGQIDKLGEQAFEQVRRRFEQISQETCDDLHKHVGVAVVTFKNLTDKSKELFEDSFQKSLEAFRERIDSFSKSVLAQLQKDAERLADDLRTRFERAARALDGEGADHRGSSSANPIEQS
jgi:hypothetical protein